MINNILLNEKNILFRKTHKNLSKILRIVKFFFDDFVKIKLKNKKSIEIREQLKLFK